MNSKTPGCPLTGLRLPGAEDEARFWARVEAAWAQCSAEANRVRRALAARGPGPDTDLSAVEGALPVFLGALTDQCRELPGGELASLDRVLERKLYDIDRADIQAVTDGSEDGFLYARGFIVAMGMRWIRQLTDEVFASRTVRRAARGTRAPTAPSLPAALADGSELRVA